jgi:hypothetical protein
MTFITAYSLLCIVAAFIGWTILAVSDVMIDCMLRRHDADNRK